MSSLRLRNNLHTRHAGKSRFELIDSNFARAELAEELGGEGDWTQISPKLISCSFSLSLQELCNKPSHRLLALTLQVTVINL